MTVPSRGGQARSVTAPSFVHKFTQGQINHRSHMVSGILIGNMSEDGFDAASKNVPEPLSGSETAEIISSLYDSAGPRVGAHLVEANSVLTFAGVRGQTEFFIKNPTSEDRESIVKANETVATKGIRIRSVGKDLNDPEGKSILMVNVGSLRGHERVSLLTKLPGVKPFNSGSGWEGFAKWNSELGRAIDTAQKDRLLPAGKEFSSDIHSGIHKGYPDQAILDFCDWLSKGRKPRVIIPDMPLLNLYEGALPLFYFYPEHQYYPNIQSTTQSWNRVLEDFYSSNWHEDIKNNPEFIRARQEIDGDRSH